MGRGLQQRWQKWWNRTVPCGLLGFLLVAMPSPGMAASLEGVTFPDSIHAGSVTLPLRGVGLAKFMRTISLYVAALYLPSALEPDRVLDDVPKRLELSYFRSIRRAEFGRAATKVLADNVPPETLSILAPRIEQMHRLYEDVKPGDRYGLTYLPGVGTELALNGVVKGTVEGADFAAAYFAIWLGPDPINQALKARLLNR
ncbi:MAG: chalcone isomerase family protein [Nitrospira sp.]|nr:MAG: chalcone isomerase family protein [Nitrospira sp.]